MKNTADESGKLMETSELTYFDKSRREFVKLSGLTLVGLVLSGPLWEAYAADGGKVSAPVVRAVATALQDAGIKVATHVPATGATAIFEAYSEIQKVKPFYSFNEEVAYTTAHGAALAGVRSTAIIKSHGLAKAANSMIDSVTLGTTVGFVAIVLDDPSGKHSDNIFDLDAFLQGTGLPFKKAGKGTVYNDVLECFLWSEALGIPVALFLNSELLSEKTEFARKRLSPAKAAFKRDPIRQVLCPPLAGYQYKVKEAKLARTDWRAIPEPKLPAVPDGLPPAWRPGASAFIPVFEVFRELRPRIPFVSGDTGLNVLFAFEPFGCVDLTSYFGGSLPPAIGAYLGGIGRSWAVTGDYAFIAAGYMGLIEAFGRRIPLKVLILNNGRAAASGGSRSLPELTSRSWPDGRPMSP
jgi:TPP-dependent indolepyruvate ferredoxin oxidoreductase alpha subunit